MPRTLFEPRVASLTVLYDGDCGFCGLIVTLLRDLDRGQRLEFVPLQHAARHADRPELVEMAGRYPLADSIHVRRPDGRVVAGGGAMLEIVDLLPVGWLFRPWNVVPGIRPVVNVLYDLVADNRAAISDWLGRRGLAVRVCDIDHGGAGQRRGAPPYSAAGDRPHR
jgi:predicted DCC family thiol-disulfide oxidoreductase YuxK